MMADIERLERALRNAHQAGDEAAARQLARAIKEARGQKAQPVEAKGYQDGAFRAATEGSHAGLMLGFDDEIGAGMMAPIHAGIDWVKGEGFSIPKAYNRLQQQLDQRKGARREEHPVASIAGEIAGGLATGAGASKAGLTLAARPAKSIAARAGLGATEGAGYGALYGAGEAKPGERLEGAVKGGALGAGVGGAVGAVGGALANRAARKAMPTAPAVGDLASQSRALYQKAEQAGVTVKAPAMNRVAANIQLVAGRINRDIRPNTAGVVDDVMALKGRNITLQELDELRQVVNQSMKRAQPQDARTLERIKSVLDNFADNAKPGDITGNIQGFQFIKDARALWARKAKTEIVEELLDLADVDTGRYTQSGLANTIRQRMSQLYKNKTKLRSFTKEEQALIRQMAKGGSNSQMVNWLAKFAPRGVVSSMLGAMGGGQLGGPLGVVGGAAVPLAGHIAGRVADRGAVLAAGALRDAAARGTVLTPPTLPNHLTPLIPAGVEASMEIGRKLSVPR